MEGQGGGRIAGKKRAVMSTKSKSERKAARTTVGTLASQLLQPRTLERYERALAQFYRWMDNMKYEIASDTYSFDLQLCEYVEHLWQEGDSKSIVGSKV